VSYNKGVFAVRAEGRSERAGRGHPPRALAVGAAVVLVLGLAATFVAATADAPPSLKLRVLSGRADLLSGGDALVEIVLPERGEVPPGLQVTVDDRDVTDAFRVRRNHRLLGLVRKLRNGEQTLTATAPGTTGARIALTNHPIGGPVFAGDQVQPWLCATDANGLGPPRDAQCNTATVTDFFYRSVHDDEFHPYDPADPPPQSEVRTTTTDQGHKVPFVVRRERGVIDRGMYDIAVLYEPGRRWRPWAPQKAWNRKLFWMFGGSCQPYHAQQPPDGRPDPSSFPGAFHDQALSRGFAVVASALTVMGNNCNSVVAAEALMMIKEHVVETYGPVRYTFGLGGSGGAIQQLQIADAYPGLLDGLVIWGTFADLLSTVSETFDCRLLSRYFDVTATQDWDPADRQAVVGHAATNTCRAWVTKFAFPAMFGDPTIGCTAPLRSFRETSEEGVVKTQPEADWVYDPDENPDGVRCTIFDYLAEIFGRRSADGFARRPYDNVGVQYGLQALLDRRISAKQFVDLNTRVGGIGIDYEFTPSRSAAGRGVLRAAYRSGQVTSGEELARIPILDASYYPSFGEMHTAFHSRKLDERLAAANGSADTMVTLQAAGEAQLFDLMDRWLTRIESDSSAGTPRDAVVRNRPPRAVNSGSFRGTNPRVAAGAPLRDDILKCRRKPLDRDDYPDVRFTRRQWARLQAAFPDGVCDWSRPGVGQTATEPWLTYAGKGLQPLGPAPRSEPVPGR
jgi:hypothetical protein